MAFPKGKFSGSKAWGWKGGRYIEPRGYVCIHMPDHHRAMKTGYVYEHILVAEQMLGRPLLPHEHVHHKNRLEKSNNNPDNLEVKSSHFAHHVEHLTRSDSNRQLPEEPNSWILCACGCGALLEKYDRDGDLENLFVTITILNVYENE